MWFQANLERGTEYPASRDAITAANRIVGAVREELRLADPTGAAGTTLHRDTTEASSTSTVLVEQLRSARALHVIAIQLDTDVAPTDLECVGPAIPHEFSSTAVDIWTAVPADMGVSEMFELTPGGPVDIDLDAIGRIDREVHWRGLALDNTTPARWWVLTDDPSLRAELADAFGGD